MYGNRGITWWPLIALCLLVAHASASAADPPKPAAVLVPGEIRSLPCDAAGKIVCQCYLPKTYDAAKRYPVLFGFSPADNDAQTAVKRWIELANRFGWIVAWCDEGVGEAKAEVLKPRFQAMIEALEKQVRVHPLRAYATGFETAAKAAMLMAQAYPQRLAGVIAEGNIEAALAGKHPAAVAVLVTSARGTPHAQEILAAKKAFEDQKIPFRLEAFPGQEPEPTSSVVLEPGLEWLDQLWWTRNDDGSPEWRAERLAAARRALDDVRQRLAESDRPGAYDMAGQVRITFENSADPAVKAVLEEARKLVEELDKDPALVGLKNYTPPKPADVVQAFLKHCRENAKFTPPEREKVAKLLEQAKDDPAALPDAMADAVGELYPEFRLALAALADENTAVAVPLLEKLRTSSDPYLAAHATYFAGRAYVLDERYEDALPLVAQTAGPWIDRTLFAADSLFLCGLAQARLQHRPAALRVLADFLKQYPDASERMRVGADTVIRAALAVADGSLDDVHDRMDDCRRRLKLARSGTPTQQRQGKIVGILERLIKEAEDEENNGGGGGGSPRGGRRSGGPAARSAIEQGEGQIGPLGRATRGKPEEIWGNVRQRDREQVLNVLKAKFPDRYRELLEQYYKSLQETDR